MSKNPHDQLFRGVLSQPEHARSIFESMLPPEACEVIDFDSLELVPGGCIEENLPEHTSDLLFRARVTFGGEVLLWLFLDYPEGGGPSIGAGVVRYRERERPRWISAD